MSFTLTHFHCLTRHVWRTASKLLLTSWGGKRKDVKAEVDSQWLSRAGTGSGRAWKRTRLGWAERSQQRKHTGDRRAGCPSTSPPTGRKHCAYCTGATHTNSINTCEHEHDAVHSGTNKNCEKLMDESGLFLLSAYLLFFSVEGLQLQRHMLLLH